MNDFENFIKKQKSKKENGKKSRHLKGVENFKADPSKDLSDRLKDKYGFGNDQNRLTDYKKKAMTDNVSKYNENPGDENGLFAKLGSYQKERNRLQEVRRNEYNQMISQKVGKDLKPQGSRSESSTPTYGDLLGKKRNQERNYRKLSNIDLPGSLKNTFSPNTLYKGDPINRTLFGIDVEKDEVRKKKEAYRLELLKQIDGKRKAATDDDLSNKKAFQSDKIKKNAEEAKTTQSLLEDDDDSDQDENKADTSISLPKNAPSFLTDPSLIPLNPLQQLQQQQIQQQLIQQQMMQQQLLQQQLLQQQLLLQQPQQHYPSNSFSFPHQHVSYPSFLTDQVIGERVDLLNTLKNEGKAGKNKTKHKKDKNDSNKKIKFEEVVEEPKFTGVADTLGRGDADRNNPNKKLQYQRELQMQIEERKKMKEEEKRKNELEDAKYTAVYTTPFRNKQPVVISNNQSKDPLSPNQPFEQPFNEPFHQPFNQPSAPSNDDSNNYPNLEINKNHSTSPSSFSPFDRVTHARGGNGIFGEPMSDEQKKLKSNYQEELRKQIEDKKKREMEMKEKMKREEEAEMKRMEEYNQQIKKKYEEELKKAEEKKQEEEKKAKLFMKMRDDEEKERLEKQNEKKKQREEEEKIKKQKADESIYQNETEQSKVFNYRPHEEERPIVVKNQGRYNFEDYSQDAIPVINRNWRKTESTKKEEITENNEKADINLSNNTNNNNESNEKIGNNSNSPNKNNKEQNKKNKNNDDKQINKHEKKNEVYANHIEVEKMQENNTEASIEKTTSNYDSTNAEDEANDADNSNNSNNDGDDDDDNDEEEYDNRRPSVTRASYVIEPKHRDSQDNFLSNINKKINGIELEDKSREKKASRRRSKWSSKNTNYPDDDNEEIRRKYNRIKRKLKDVDMRPLSSSSLDPDELARHNEQRLQSLKRMAGEAMESLDKYITSPRTGRSRPQYDDDEEYWLKPSHRN